MITGRHRGWILGTGLLLGLAACGPTTYEAEIDLVRIEADSRLTSTTDKVSDEQRFGYKKRAETEDVGPPRFGYELPEGWTELPKNTYRTINLLVAGKDKAECYLTILAGGGGALVANVNRWRGQVGLPTLPASDIAKLPKVRIPGLNRDAVRVDLAGSYKGMSDQTGRADSRFLGHIWQWGDYGCYLVCVGPKKLIDAELPKFEAFLRSLRQMKGKAPTSKPSRARDVLAWDLPEGWVDGPEKAMRIATFFVGTDKKTQCYIAQAGGSAEDNITRWRRQVGAAPLSNDEFKKLPRTTVLGREAILVTAKGDFSGGMGATPIKDAMLRGAVVPLPGTSLFIKMLGPRATVEAQEAEFKSFVTSLRPRAPAAHGAGKAGDRVGPTREKAGDRVGPTREKAGDPKNAGPGNGGKQ